MELKQYSILSSGGAVHGNDRLQADLHVPAGPQHARVDGARGRSAAVERLLHGYLDERDQPVERFGEPDILHERLQVQKAVLDREPYVQNIWILRRRLGSVVRN